MPESRKDPAEVLTYVTVSWDIMASSPVTVNEYFDGKYHLHLRGRKINQAKTIKKQAESKVFGGTRTNKIF
jgi:hypothetical protein